MILTNGIPKYLLTLGFLCLAVDTFAGGKSSGGGNAVVCRDSKGEIQTVELLDLYEGRILRNLSYPLNNSSTLDQALQAAKKIDASTDRIDLQNGTGIIQATVKRLSETLKFLPPDVELVPIDDSKHIILPKECQISQIARYEDNDDVFVNGDLWQKMNSQNQAALLTHEALFWMLRMYGEKNSIRTRKIIAHLFANLELLSISHGIPEVHENCEAINKSDGTQFATFSTYPDQHGNIVLQFFIFDNLMMLSKSTAILAGAHWPLSTKRNNYENFYSSSLDSISDKGKHVFVTIPPEFTDKQNLISTKDNGRFPFEKFEFTCH